MHGMLVRLRCHVRGVAGLPAAILASAPNKRVMCLNWLQLLLCPS